MTTIKLRAKRDMFMEYTGEQVFTENKIYVAHMLDKKGDYPYSTTDDCQDENFLTESIIEKDFERVA